MKLTEVQARTAYAILASAPAAISSTAIAATLKLPRPLVEESALAVSKKLGREPVEEARIAKFGRRGWVIVGTLERLERLELECIKAIATAIVDEFIAVAGDDVADIVLPRPSMLEAVQ